MISPSPILAWSIKAGARAGSIADEAFLCGSSARIVCSTDKPPTPESKMPTRNGCGAVAAREDRAPDKDSGRAGEAA